MYDNDSKGITYGAGFFMLIAFAVAGLFIASTISIPLWQQMTGTEFDTMQTGIKNPANANAAKIIQVINAIVGFLLPTLFTAFLLSKKPMRLLGLSSPGIKPVQIGLVILIVVCSLVAASSLSYITTQIPIPADWKIRFDKMEEEYTQQAAATISLQNNADFILALLIKAFLPALCEEVLFRGGFQNFLTRSTRNPWLSIVVVSLLFSLAHISFYGFISRFFLGIILGALFHYSGKLWLSILAHFINNAIIVTILYVSTQQGKILENVMKRETGNLWGIAAVPIVIGLFILLQKTFSAKRIQLN